MQQLPPVLGPGCKTRRTSVALRGRGAALATEGSLAGEAHLARCQEQGVDPSPNLLLR